MAHAKAVRYAKHKEEVDKINKRTHEHYQHKADEAKQERLRAAQRLRDKEARREQERKRQAVAHEQAVELFKQHDGGTGVLGQDALCALLAVALPQIGLAPPDAQTVGVLLRRAEMEGVTRAGQDGERGVTLPGVSSIILKYKDYLREQAVMDAAFAAHDLSGEGAMDGAGLVAMMAKLAPERLPTESDALWLLHTCADAQLAATPGMEHARISRQELPVLLPALAKWLRKGAAAGCEGDRDADGGLLLQGLPVHEGQPAVQPTPAAVAVVQEAEPPRASPRVTASGGAPPKAASSACTVL